MFTLRRWWNRHGLRMGLVCITLGVAWTARQTQGAAIYEIYQWVSRPFQGEPPNEDIWENAQVEELQQRLVELESENQQLKGLLGYVSSRPAKGLAAPIIGRSADHWWQQIILGRGSQDGIRVGAIVSGTGGVVGRVVQVSSTTSRVLLISDPSSQIGVTIARSRFMGYMRGQSESRAVMEFFDKVPDVRPGDVVTTSSFSRLFPAGLPIGRVESVNLSKSPAPEAIIELSAPISYLEWVIVDANPKAEAANATNEPGAPP